MQCGAQEKSCWCTRLPVLPPSNYQADAACLCADCLQTQLDAGVVLYGIANCDTVKKARVWLAEQGVAYAFWDYKKHGVPEGKLAHAITTLGWKNVVNTRGTTWRGLPDDAKAVVVDAPSTLALLLSNASAIKRPLVSWGNTYAQQLTIGFDAALWQGIIKI
jgi:Spx/MgsR family transcriptional regulator